MSKQPMPHQRLISVAAELARGPNLDERFGLDARLPKWALRNIERICDRQRELCCVIRDNADKLRQERDALERELTVLKDMLIEVRRVYRPSGAGGQQLTAWDSFEAYLKSLPRKPSYEGELEDAAWIADTGRYNKALETGELNEVEPIKGPAIIGRGAVIDAVLWPNNIALPRSVK